MSRPSSVPVLSMTVLAVLAMTTPSAQTASAQAADPRACAALRELARPDLTITRAEPVAAGTLPQDNPARAALTGAARSDAALPAHCLVEATIAPRTGAQGKPTGIRIQLRMPEAWNGRFLYQGGGGMDGVLNEALGAAPFSGSTAKPALNRGYAVVSTDSGHQGRDSADASFAYDQQARLDYAYAAIGTVTREARALVAAYYGQTPGRSYFMGCSNGGREAMMAAQRFPADFDGIIAGNPGFRLSRAAIAQTWDVNAFTRAAPTDSQGRPILARALSPQDQDLIGKAVLAACDGADGVADGSIDAMSACRFDPAALQCPGEKTASCLSAAQVSALKTVFSGAHDSRGGRIYATWPWDAGIAAPEWRAWKLGTSATAVANARNTTLGQDSLRKYFVTPPDPDLDPAAIDYDAILARVAQTAAINDADATLLSSFTAHGGKMLVIQGNSDPVFSADDLRDYWRELSRDNGGADSLGHWARLFIVPGMTHCGGGPALDDIDPLTALESWVEQGEAPTRLTARGRKSFPGRTRPLCPYPLEARYVGGDVEQASSFVCR